MTTTIGCDIARKGADKTVLCVAADDVSATRIRFHRHQAIDLMATVGLIVQLAVEVNATSIQVDADGIGAGVYDRLVELTTTGEFRAAVVELRGGRSASDPRRFGNARSEWLWGVRERLDPSSTTLPLILPDDAALAYQATTLRWSVDSAGRTCAERKADWARRTGRSSPDELDALAYALAQIGQGWISL